MNSYPRTLATLFLKLIRRIVVHRVFFSSFLGNVDSEILKFSIADGFLSALVLMLQAVLHFRKKLGASTAHTGPRRCATRYRSAKPAFCLSGLRFSGVSCYGCFHGEAHNVMRVSLKRAC